jgi:hypothetical protein
VPAIIFFRNTVCSQDEQVCRDLELINKKRPLIEESSMLFKYLWRHRNQDQRYQALMEQQGQQWNAVLFQYGHEKNIRFAKLPDAQISLDASFMDDEIQQTLEGVMNQSQRPENQALVTPLVYRGALEVKDRDVLYAEYYYLTSSGIPTEKRARYWQDILKVPYLVQAEEKIQRQSNRKYQANLSVYENFIQTSLTTDCLAFRQID